jgi:hypothetical protein
MDLLVDYRLKKHIPNVQAREFWKTNFKHQNEVCLGLGKD